MKKSIYVMGPTASGKSDLAVKIAHTVGGEIIGCDSRQIYRHMDIGSGKEPGELIAQKRTRKHVKKFGKESSLAYVSSDIPHYLISTHHPNTDFSAGKFVKRARRLQADILARGKIPIICGGTMFWAQTLLEGDCTAPVPPDPALRQELTQKTSEELLACLQRVDAARADAIRQRGEHNNLRRIIRSLEIVAVRGHVPPEKKPDYTSINNENLILIPYQTKEILDLLIKKRLLKRIDAGMLLEVQNLHDLHGVSWPRLERFGLEYKWCKKLLRGEISRKIFEEKLYFDSIHYAKRQRTWLKRWSKRGALITAVHNTHDALGLSRDFL